MAAQLIDTKGCPERRLRPWISAAVSSLPVPVSPVMRTLLSVAAIVSIDVRRRSASPPVPINGVESRASFRSACPAATEAFVESTSKRRMLSPRSVISKGILK